MMTPLLIPGRLYTAKLLPVVQGGVVTWLEDTCFVLLEAENHVDGWTVGERYRLKVLSALGTVCDLFPYADMFKRWGFKLVERKP